MIIFTIISMFTIYEYNNVKIEEILLLTFCWWHGFTPKQLKHEYGFEGHTITDWNNFCREVAIEEVINKSEKIGGPGKIVEIDESMFGRNKCITIFNNIYLLKRGEILQESTIGVC